MSETRVWRWFFNDVEKEEAWLNEMAAKGLNLVVPGRLAPPPYRFEQGDPGEWVYRMEFMPASAGSVAGKRYLEFMSDSGIETVFASSRAAYFRKRAADGPFEVYSDLDSRIAHFRRVRRWILLLAALEVPTIAAMALMLAAPGGSPGDAVPLAAVAGVLVLGLFVEVMALAQVARETRRIKALAAQRSVFE